MQAQRNDNNAVTPAAGGDGGIMSPAAASSVRSGGMGSLSNAGSPTAVAALTAAAPGVPVGAGFAALAGTNGGGQGGVPSPTTFASMAAAVGVQNPLEEGSSSANAATVNHLGATMHDGRHASSAPGIASDEDLVAAAMQAMDPYSALIYNADHFANTQLKQLQQAADSFYDLMEGVCTKQVDPRSVVSAHTLLLSTLDHLIATASQAGFAGLPCSKSPSANDGDDRDHRIQPNEGNAIDPAVNADERGGLQNGTSGSIIARLAMQSRDTFERRERMRESVSAVTNILTHV